MYLRQEWRDPRLAFDPSLNGGITKIKLEDNKWEDIWTPDTFFRNEKTGQFHIVSTPNRLLRLNSTGFLWYVTK